MPGHFQLIPTSLDLLPLKQQAIDFALAEPGHRSPVDDPDSMQRDFTAHLRLLMGHARGENLPEGWVRTIRFWYLDPAGRLLGNLHLRTELSPLLLDLGGNIGYSVAPAHRGQGHATRMLAMGLAEARREGLDRVLLTTAADNLASRRVIENNHGHLEKVAWSTRGKCETAYYWISL